MRKAAYLFCLLWWMAINPLYAGENSAINFPSVIHKTTTIQLHNQENVSSITFSGHISLKTRDSYARVILVDDKGNKFLICELIGMYSQKPDTLLQNEGFETTILPKGTCASYIKVVAQDATIVIEDIALSQEIYCDEAFTSMLDLQKRKRQNREKVIIEAINSYNSTHGILWQARKNMWSEMTYQQRQNSLGFADEDTTWGLEYYGGGIFPLGASDYTSLQSLSDESSYAPEFNWRNRHGQNWLTPVRNQMLSLTDNIDSNCCWAFAAVGVAEARANLYYNQHLDLDLSEEFVIAYSRYNDSSSPYYGGSPVSALNFIALHGIIDEDSCPFGSYWDSSIPIDSIPRQERLAFESVGTFNSLVFTPDTLKKRLIHSGPITASIRWGRTNHAMVLAGYKILSENDTISLFGQQSVSSGRYVVPAGSPLVGSTCWIFKNSYGAPSDQRDDGYLYAVIPNFGNIMLRNSCGYLKGLVSSINLSDDDIVVEDADCDGYYNWGIGPKPGWIPSYISDMPDGDDSNEHIGQMDSYGFTTPVTRGLNDTLYVIAKANIKYDRMVNYQIVVKHGGILNVYGNIDMADGAHIYIENGGSMIVDGATINNANVLCYEGSQLHLKNNAKINKHPHSNFTIPIGAELRVDYGGIQ